MYILDKGHSRLQSCLTVRLLPGFPPACLHIWRDFTILNILGSTPHLSNTYHKASLGTESYAFRKSTTRVNKESWCSHVFSSIGLQQRSCHNTPSPSWSHSGTLACSAITCSPSWMTEQRSSPLCPANWCRASCHSSGGPPALVWARLLHSSNLQLLPPSSTQPASTVRACSRELLLHTTLV